MKIFYSDHYNIDLGILNRLHPFDGLKFTKVSKAIKDKAMMDVVHPCGPTDQTVIDDFCGPLMQRLLKKKRYVFNALEIPYLPFIPLSMLEKRVLLPMRWAVQGTIESTQEALGGTNSWNLAGGYHHASPNSAEGFCIYNDIGIAHQELLKSSAISQKDRILIVDVDAHHGNGNAHTFMDNGNVLIMDVFNDDIYPHSSFTKDRVDIAVALHKGCSGSKYLESLNSALERLSESFRIAFVVAGTDVLASDSIGGFKLSIEDVSKRDSMILEKLKKLSTPAVFIGGGGYSKESAEAIIKSISNMCQN